MTGNTPPSEGAVLSTLAEGFQYTPDLSVCIVHLADTLPVMSTLAKAGNAHSESSAVKYFIVFLICYTACLPFFHVVLVGLNCFVKLSYCRV